MGLVETERETRVEVRDLLLTTYYLLLTTLSHCHAIGPTTAHPIFLARGVDVFGGAATAHAPFEPIGEQPQGHSSDHM